MQAHLAGSAARARGAVMIELALSMSVTLPLLLGVGAIGVRLGRTLQATQVTRDVAHMYALGADFSLGGSQAIARTLSRDFSLTDTGNAVLLLSRVMKVQQTDCTAAGLGTCPNLNLAVITQRIAIGNTALRTSSFGTPPVAYIGSGGNIAAANYCKQSSLIATGFDAILSLAAGQSSTVVEGYFSMPELNLMAFPEPGGGYYVRFLF
ncbi:MAG: hypothetical protein ABI806_11670 [Candidatus Solibacter sp.]